MTQPATQRLVTEATLPELAQDAVAAMFRAGTNVTFTYDDAAGTFTINASGSGAGSTGSSLTASALALVKLHASFAERDTKPVIVVVRGDSFNVTPSPLGWTAPFSTQLQRAYPKADGTPSPAPTTDNTVAYSSRPVGVQIIDGGVGGSSSGAFAITNDGSFWAGFNPAMSVWMTSTNDPGNGISAAQMKSNLLAGIAAQKAATTHPHVFVLVHPYKRPSGYQAGWDTWEAYGTAMKDIATADPDNVVYIDLAPAFAALGVPGTDPLTLIGDGLHPSTVGANFIGDLIFSAVRTSLTATGGAASAQYTGTATADTTDPAITSFTATAGDSQVALAWAGSDNVGVVQYILTRSNDSTVLTLSSPTATSYTDTGRTNGTPYTYTVKALDAAGNVSAVSTASATPAASGDVTPPTVPGTPTATGAAGSIGLTWAASTDAVGVTQYRVYRSDAPTVVLGTSATATYTDSTATVGTAYTYTVAAADAAGNVSAKSAASNSATATAPVSAGVVDTFNRADSTTSLGTPSDGGVAWEVAGTFGISGNAAYVPSGAQGDYAVRKINGATAVANATLTCTLAGTGNYANEALLLGTAPDVAGSPASLTGYVPFLDLFGNTSFYKLTARTGYTQITTTLPAGASFASGDVVKIVKAGSAFTFYKNGTQIGTATDSSYATVLQGGFYQFGAPTAGAKYDSLTLQTP